MSVINYNMVESFDAIDIRAGTEEDTHAIIQFASMLNEDPFISKEKWYKTLETPTTFPVIAVNKNKIIGKIQATIIDTIGWLEPATVSPEFRKLGLSHSLVKSAMDWLIENGAKSIRTTIDSDNLIGRKIVERHNFIPNFLSINPSTKISTNDNLPEFTNDFAKVLDETMYPHFKSMLKFTSYNIMIDGHWVPFTQPLLNQLIDNNQIYTNIDQSTLIIISKHALPSEIHGFISSNTIENYSSASLALKGYASRDLATIAVAHSSSNREAMLGFAKQNFGWGQPHTVIMYSKEI